MSGKHWGLRSKFAVTAARHRPERVVNRNLIKSMLRIPQPVNIQGLLDKNRIWGLGCKYGGTSYEVLKAHQQAYSSNLPAL